MVAQNRERGVVGRADAADERVSEAVARVHVGRGERADDRADGGVLGHGTTQETDVGRRLVDVGHRDRQLFFKSQSAGVGRADADRVGTFRLKVEAGVGLELASQNRERGIVGRPGAAHERVGELVALIDVGREQRTDDGAGFGVFRHGTAHKAEVGRRLIGVDDGAGGRALLRLERAAVVGLRYDHANQRVGISADELVIDLRCPTDRLTIAEPLVRQEADAVAIGERVPGRERVAHRRTRRAADRVCLIDDRHAARHRVVAVDDRVGLAAPVRRLVVAGRVPHGHLDGDPSADVVGANRVG